MGKVPKCSSHQDASSDMQHDLLRSLCDLDLGWPEVKVTNLPFKVKKHISRSGLTRGTQWCQNYSPILCSSEVIDKKTFPLKNVVLTLMTSGAHTIDGNANLKAQIDSEGPGLSFGYFEILLACIVIKIIASFWENSLLLGKFDLFWPPVTSILTSSKNDPYVFCSTLHGLSNAVYRFSMRCVVLEISGGGLKSTPAGSRLAQTPAGARVKPSVRRSVVCSRSCLVSMGTLEPSYSRSVVWSRLRCPSKHP